MAKPPNPYLAEKTKAQKDLAEWRAFLAHEVAKPVKPRRKFVGPPQLQSTALWKMQKGRCWICGKSLDLSYISRDHLHPRSKGGAGKPNNILLAHRRCNKDRGNKGIYTREEALAFLESLPG